MAKFLCPKCNKPCDNEEGCFLHKPKKGLNKSSKLKSKRKTEEEKEKQKEDIEKMWVFFLEIWSERPHYSQVSGKYLGEIPLSTFFDHLLPKSSYPHLKYEKENIILCTFEEHSLKEAGFCLEKHKQAIEEAKKRFL